MQVCQGTIFTPYSQFKNNVRDCSTEDADKPSAQETDGLRDSTANPDSTAASGCDLDKSTCLNTKEASDSFQDLNQCCSLDLARKSK